jgi:H+/Cl- antiporter ClcA
MALKSNNLKKYLKLLLLSLLSGVIGGAVGGAFARLITLITNLRLSNGWLICFLPVVASSIVFIYKKLGIMGVGTNDVLKSVNDQTVIDGKLTFGIFITAAISHLFGASVGREGAALQIGGGISAFLSKKFNLSQDDTKILIRVGMSAVFAAVFGTPLTAFLFALEVAEVGKIHLKSVLPCLVSSFSGYAVALLIGIHPERFHLTSAPVFSLNIIWQLAVLSLLLSALAIGFAHSLHFSEKLAHKLFKNPYLRITVGGAILLLLTILIGNQDYNGAGIGVIERIFDPNYFSPNSLDYSPFAFILKLIFTCIAVSAGFKGGEIVPTLFIGATFGALVADLIGLPTAFGAALGMVLLFCGVTDCLLASVALSFELFSGVGFLYFIPCLIIVFVCSGKISLYTEQKYNNFLLMPSSVRKGDRRETLVEGVSSVK